MGVRVPTQPRRTRRQKKACNTNQAGQSQLSRLSWTESEDASLHDGSAGHTTDLHLTASCMGARPEGQQLGSSLQKGNSSPGTRKDSKRPPTRVGRDQHHGHQETKEARYLETQEDATRDNKVEVKGEAAEHQAN